MRYFTGLLGFRDEGWVIYEQQLAVYDDSIQPTGTIHWKNDGPFGTPNPHVEMKKLRHSLVLHVEGPSESKIKDCANTAFAASVLAAIAAAIATGGIAAANAAITAGVSTMGACIGQGVAKVEDRSHWIYWDV